MRVLLFYYYFIFIHMVLNSGPHACTTSTYLTFGSVAVSHDTEETLLTHTGSQQFSSAEAGIPNPSLTSLKPEPRGQNCQILLLDGAWSLAPLSNYLWVRLLLLMVSYRLLKIFFSPVLKLKI